MKDNFKNISYKKHEKTYDLNLFDENIIFNKKSVNWYRHKRMYDTLNVLINDDHESSWLSIGDGNYGHGANHVISQGSNCLATDISIDYLEKSKKIGYIEDYQYANAENLPFDDNTFDYAFVKEAYHHFPRPTIAVYEMLRVSKKGIVLIEPNDAFTGANIIRLFLRFVLKIFGKKIQRHQWEDVGNYVFTISRREIEKIALGLNYKFIAFKGCNDHYIRGAQDEILSDNGPIGRKIINKIKLQDLFCQLKLTDYSLLCAILLKKEPSAELIENLSKDGFETTVLPNNPYT
jgi:ubiquinone/menaquinone biosynthesis C-methylase UbiE